MIIPALDLIDGQVVRLYQGDYNQTTEYAKDPVQTAQFYASQGAQWLHIVDLSGAKDPTKRQTALIAAMAKAAHMKVQAGGGIRQREDVEALLNAGIDRVVIGSMAVKQTETVQQWIQELGADKFTLALDVNINVQGQAMIATHGWQQDSGVELSSLLQAFLPLGIEHVLCTDISRDGTLQGSNEVLYTELAAQFPQISWQASGGIGSLDDIERLKPTKVGGVILGRALLEGKFTLADAIQLWGQ